MTDAPAIGDNNPPSSAAHAATIAELEIELVAKKRSPHAAPFPEPEINVEELMECLDYNPMTGAFTWKTSGKGRKKNAVAGGPTGGYWAITFNGVRIYAHRIAWRLMTGAWPAAEIDHKNRDRTDNSFANLREASASQNKVNAKPRRNNTAGVRGVGFCRMKSKWRVRVWENGKERHMGYFESKDDALHKYAEEATRIYGHFAQCHMQRLEEADNV